MENHGTKRDLENLAADLRRQRPSLPPAAQPHASNLIEQLDGIKTRPTWSACARSWRGL